MLAADQRVNYGYTSAIGLDRGKSGGENKRGKERSKLRKKNEEGEKKGNESGL